MFSMSKTLLAAALTLLVGTLVSAAPAAAQEPTTARPHPHRAGQRVTGCLSKGPGEGTFTLQQDDGKSFALASTTVKLDEHVGHTVTVKGTPPAVVADAVTGKDTGMVKDTVMQRMGPPGGVLNVTSVTHVKPEC
jgi:Protein of unknown function (DUF5818)